MHSCKHIERITCSLLFCPARTWSLVSGMLREATKFEQQEATARPPMLCMSSSTPSATAVSRCILHYAASYIITAGRLQPVRTLKYINAVTLVTSYRQCKKACGAWGTVYCLSSIRINLCAGVVCAGGAHQCSSLCPQQRRWLITLSPPTSA